MRSILAKVFCGLFVEWIIGIRLEEQVLQTNHDRVEIKDRFPVLTKDIETHVAIQVDVRVIDLLCALDLRRIVWIIAVDGESEFERSALVHALIWLDCERKVEHICWVREVGLHRLWQFEFGQIFLHA